MTAVEISWVFNVNQIFFSLMIFFGGPLCGQFGARELCFTASILSAVSYAVLARANSAMFMIVVHGVIFGKLYDLEHSIDR